MAETTTPSTAVPATAAAPAAATGQPGNAVQDLLSDTAAASTRRVKLKRSVPEAVASIQSSYNNTIVTLSDMQGQVLAWSSSGSCGFAGNRKSTSYAASQAAQNVAEKSKAYGVERVHVRVKGIGSGREQAIRSLQVGGLNVLSIKDVTPVAHGGCRRKKPRRV